MSLNIEPLKNAYYNGDSSKIEDLKSMIRVEALTLTAAVMMKSLAEDIADAAVDVISFKVLLNIIMERIKESSTYRQVVDYIINKINALVGRIVPKLKIDSSLIDSLSDKVAEKAGESLDDTINEYRDRIKNSILQQIYQPLKSAHDALIHEKLTENESRERRLKIYDVAEEGVGTLNAIATVKEVSESVEQASSLAGGFLNGMPQYEAALKIVEKVAGVLAKAAAAMDKYETYHVLSDIVDAYRGDIKAVDTRGTEDTITVIYDVEDNGDALAKLQNLMRENYSSDTMSVEQVKMGIYALKFLNFNGSIAMLNSTAERYSLASKYFQFEKHVNIDAPTTVIANREFNITVKTNFNTTIAMNSEKIQGNKSVFTLTLPEGSHEIKIIVDNKEISLNITSVNISKVRWRIAGDIMYASTPQGIIAINAKRYNETPEEIIGTGESSENGGTSDNGGSESNGENPEKSTEGENSAMYIPRLPVIISAVIVTATVIGGIIAFKRKH